MKIGNLTYFIYNTQFGQVTIGSNSEEITEVFLGVKEMSGKRKPCAITNEASTQILQYFAGLRKNFTLKMHLAGTEFERKVFLGLLDLNYGDVITPSELACKIGLDKSYRHVGKAALNNRLEILIPSHRLILKSGFEKPTPSAKKNLALRRLEKQYMSLKKNYM